LGSVNLMFAILFLLFILLASLTVMNMLVGVLVEVVSVVSAVEKEQMEVNFVKTSLQNMLNNNDIDSNKDSLISKSEFANLLSKPQAARALQNVGVDAVGLVDFSDYIFHGDSDSDRELTFTDFIEMVLQLRGTNKATVKDIVDLRKFVRKELVRLEDIMLKGRAKYLGTDPNQSKSRQRAALKHNPDSEDLGGQVKDSQSQTKCQRNSEESTTPTPGGRAGIADLC